MAVVDNTGIEPSTFDDYLAEFIRAAQTVFGADFASDERGIFGQLVGLLSRRLEGADIGLGGRDERAGHPRCGRRSP